MLHVLQYFEGTSMAAVGERIDLIKVHAVNGGPNVRGSFEGSVAGKGWTFLGKILPLILAGQL